MPDDEEYGAHCTSDSLITSNGGGDFDPSNPASCKKEFHGHDKGHCCGFYPNRQESSFCTFSSIKHLSATHMTSTNKTAAGLEFSMETIKTISPISSPFNRLVNVPVQVVKLSFQNLATLTTIWSLITNRNELVLARSVQISILLKNRFLERTM